MFAGAILYAATSVASPYPAQEILTAFGEVCLDSAAKRQDNAGNARIWKRLAAEHGWSEITSPPERDADYRRDAPGRSYYWAKSLDYQIYTTLSSGNKGRITDAGLFRKQVAGRDVYLSILGVDSENPSLAECRLRDPLGDGISKSPVTKEKVEIWLGHPVKDARGWYRSHEYWWSNGGGRSSIRVHFGFDARQLGVSSTRDDPYALYGMTLVRSDYSEIIVT